MTSTSVPSAAPLESALRPTPPGSVEIIVAPDHMCRLEVRVLARRAQVLTHVQLVGQLDLTNSAFVDGVLAHQARNGCRFLRLDLSGLTFCDCSGLGVLVRSHNRQLSRGGTLVLVGPPPLVGRLLALSHLDEALFVADGVDQPPRTRPACRLDPKRL